MKRQHESDEEAADSFELLELDKDADALGAAFSRGIQARNSATMRAELARFGRMFPDAILSEYRSIPWNDLFTAAVGPGIDLRPTTFPPDVSTKHWPPEAFAALTDTEYDEVCLSLATCFAAGLPLGYEFMAFVTGNSDAFHVFWPLPGVDGPKAQAARAWLSDPITGKTLKSWFFFWSIKKSFANFLPLLQGLYARRYRFNEDDYLSIYNILQIWLYRRRKAWWKAAVANEEMPRERALYKTSVEWMSEYVDHVEAAEQLGSRVAAELEKAVWHECFESRRRGPTTIYRLGAEIAFKHFPSFDALEKETAEYDEYGAARVEKKLADPALRLDILLRPLAGAVFLIKDLILPPWLADRKLGAAWLTAIEQTLVRFREIPQAPQICIANFVHAPFFRLTDTRYGWRDYALSRLFPKAYTKQLTPTPGDAGTQQSRDAAKEQQAYGEGKIVASNVFHHFPVYIKSGYSLTPEHRIWLPPIARLRLALASIPDGGGGDLSVEKANVLAFAGHVHRSLCLPDSRRYATVTVHFQKDEDPLQFRFYRLSQLIPYGGDRLQRIATELETRQLPRNLLDTTNPICLVLNQLPLAAFGFELSLIVSFLDFVVDMARVWNYPVVLWPGIVKTFRRAGMTTGEAFEALWREAPSRAEHPWPRFEGFQGVAPHEGNEFALFFPWARAPSVQFDRTVDYNLVPAELTDPELTSLKPGTETYVPEYVRLPEFQQPFFVAEETPMAPRVSILSAAQLEIRDSFLGL